jgi:hypothetical protein
MFRGVGTRPVTPCNPHTTTPLFLLYPSGQVMEIDKEIDKVIEVRKKVDELCNYLDKLRQEKKDIDRLIIVAWLKMCYEMLYLIDEYLKHRS